MTDKTTAALKLAEEALARLIRWMETRDMVVAGAEREALAAIREALAGENNGRTNNTGNEKCHSNFNRDSDLVPLSKKALAEPVKQEPVAWMWVCVDVESRSIETGILFNRGADDENTDWTPLYAAPVDAKAIRAEALEEAAKWCQRYHDKLEELGEDDYQTGRGRGAIDCAAAIRGLK